jgi:nicotinamidase-related amidase
VTTDAVATIDPSRTALLVMDMQNALVERFADGQRLVAGCKEAIARARQKGVTIGYVRVAFADGELESAPETSAMAKRLLANAAAMDANHPGTQVHSELAPQDGDVAVRKTRVGPFSTTDLHDQLEARGIDTLILTGIATSGVVLSAVRDGFDRDYQLFVVSDLTSDPQPDVHEFLTTRIFPQQAQVIAASQLADLLA